MLRAGINDPENPLILMGLTEENISRLKDDKPIMVTIRSFGVDLPGKIGIFYGKTEYDLNEIMKSHGFYPPEGGPHWDPRQKEEAEARNKHEHILIATVGLPRSGKSTWARKQSYPVVCPDSIRLAIYGEKFLGKAEPYVWLVARTMVESLFLSGHKTVILDSTMMKKARRQEWLNKKWGTYYKVFDTPKDVCIQRARDTAYEDIIPVIERMSQEFEPLDDEEPTW